MMILRMQEQKHFPGQRPSDSGYSSKLSVNSFSEGLQVQLVPVKTVGREVCRLSKVTKTLFLERNLNRLWIIFLHCCATTDQILLTCVF